MPFIPDEQQPVQNSSVPEQPKSGFVADEKQPHPQELKDYLEAPAIGAFHMIDSLATTLLKAGAKTGVFPKITPESVQSTYDVNTNKFNKSMEEHPYITGAGALAGGVLETAPLMAIPGAQGAGIGSLGAIGRLGANIASNAAQGGLLGALTSSQGQNPNQILNPENAKMGGVLGAAGTIAGTAIGHTIEGAQALAQAQKTAPGVKIFSSDLPTNSVLGNMWKYTVNNLLSKLPSVLGTEGGRDIQTQQVQQMLGNHITQIAQDTAKTGPVRLMNVLKQHTDELNQTEHSLWNKFTDQVPNTPVDRPASLPILKEILNDPNQVANLTTNKGGEIQALRQGLQASTPNQMKQFKGDIWGIINRLSSKDNLTAGEQSLLNSAKELYGANINDLKGAIQGVDGTAPALQAYEAANQFTKNYRNTLGNLPQLQKAILDSQNQMGKVSDFVKWIKSPSTTPQEISQASKILGKTGTQELGGQLIQKAFSDAQTTVGNHTALDVNKLLANFKNLDESAQSQLSKPAMDQLQGYVNVLKDVADAQAGGGSTVSHAISGSAIASGTVGAAITHNPVLGAALTMTPAALSFFAKNSPIKNAIIGLNKLTRGANSDVNAYMTNKVINTLIKGGIQVKVNQDGSINVNHKYDETTPKKMQVSLNDWDNPGKYPMPPLQQGKSTQNPVV